ncbi:hypothetical protein SMD11_1032 [Streptomyces albireticuli]|uniref:Uncharacterized protein n=1 Tax=Streptomyces albireticuli TaxID=1940 RepID=A0A1Z2KXE0_9ACTN|nr:hypothetical protein SMD11_1032 [Streptomyces albireticuli]
MLSRHLLRRSLTSERRHCPFVALPQRRVDHPQGELEADCFFHSPVQGSKAAIGPVDAHDHGTLHRAHRLTGISGQAWPMSFASSTISRRSWCGMS